LAQDMVRAALTVLGAGVSATFLWLWSEKATPLALAMTFSWAGATALVGSWLAADLAGGPVMPAHPTALGALALYLTGTLLHLQAIRQAFGLGDVALLSVLGGAVAAAALALAVMG